MKILKKIIQLCVSCNSEQLSFFRKNKNFEIFLSQKKNFSRKKLFSRKFLYGYVFHPILSNFHFFEKKVFSKSVENKFSQLSDKLFVKERNVRIYLTDILSNFGILKPFGREDISDLRLQDFQNWAWSKLGVADVENFGLLVFLILSIYIDHLQPVSAWWPKMQLNAFISP